MKERSSKKIRFIFNALLFLAMVFSLAIPMQAALAEVGPAVVWVDGSGTCTGHALGVDCFATIQRGIDAVAPSGTVNVLAGTLDVTTTILVNKSVTISGEAGAIVQGTDPSVVSIFEISASDVTLQNLEITHSALPAFVAAGWVELPNSLIRVPVSLGLTGLSIQDNKIYVPAQAGEMKTWNGVGITVGSNTTTGVSITGNTIYNVRDGAVVQYGNTATFNANDIYDTKGGIMNYTNTQADADNRTVSNNTWGTTHNEWDIVWNTAYYVPDYNASVLVLSGANNDAYVLDRRAADAAGCAALTGNRSHIFVDAAGAAVAAHPAKGNFNEPFATVQLGVDAVVPGGTVYVAAGTYTEQVTVNKSLGLFGDGAGSSIIAAPATLPASSNITSAIVRFDGAGVDAELTGFTVTGPGPTGCGSISAGIFVSGGANAYIHDNTVVDVRDSTFSGCQNGISIQVGRNFWTTTGTATIENNIITGYQKGGIVVDNAGSAATLTGNTVTGAGTVDVTAQNGIQISRGANATLMGNTVSGNSFHLDGNAWDWGAAGVLLYQAGDVSMSGGNSLHDNDQNLYVDSATAFTAGTESIGPSTAPLYKGYEVINLTALNFDLTGVTFSEATNCQIEERTWHGVDDTTYGPVYWVAGNLYVASPESTIQNAIDVATAGDTINVCAGTYAESLNVSKSLNLHGAQAGVNVAGRTAADANEATIQGLMTVNASNVFVNGFTLTNPGATYAMTIPPTSSNTTVTYNMIDNVGAPTLGSNVHSIVFQNGADSVNISHNSFNNINANAKSASAIGVLDSASSDPSNGLVINDNTFTNIGSVSKGAYGIIINNKAGAPGAEITFNTFSGLNGNWTHAIGLETNITDPVVASNNFSNLTANGAGTDVAAIFFEADPSSDTAKIMKNRFDGTAFYGVAIHPDSVALGYTATAIKNWWGDASGPGLIAAGTGALVGPNVDYTPWCTDMDCTSVFYLVTGDVTASDGTFTNRVFVTWDAYPGANRYILYRGTTAVPGDATELVRRNGTAYADRTATPGVTYNYWVKACYFADCSDFSATDTGWKGMLPPTDLQASDGTFSDKVQVTWTAAPGAISYEVYRSELGELTKTLLDSPAGTNFDDTTATPGVYYKYWVKACAGANCSDFGHFERGWRNLPAPQNLVASDGTFADKVLVSWDASSEAFNYIVYRGITAVEGDAVEIRRTKGTQIADRTATPGTTYYYWVKAATRRGLSSDFSNSDTGWR